MQNSISVLLKLNADLLRLQILTNLSNAGGFRIIKSCLIKNIIYSLNFLVPLFLFIAVGADNYRVDPHISMIYYLLAWFW